MGQLLANAVLAVHAAFAGLVVGGLVGIIVGGLCHWQWIRNRRFRFLHLLGIGVVVCQTWLGIVCPLTTLEMWLRKQAGAVGYEGGFIEHWLRELLYYDAPAWVFTVLYTVFGLLVVATWFWLPPRRGKTGTGR